MTEFSIKRILVALDAGASDKSTLLAATTLASKLNAQLEALFVEDINLLRLAELPIAREISSSSRRIRQLTLTDMEQQLRRQVERMRRSVEAIAQQAKLKVEFRVLRGQVASELSLAVQQMDMLVMGKNTQLLQRSEKLGSITQNLLSTSKCNMLLLQHGAALERPIAVLYTGSEASRRALQLGLQLAQGDHDQLSVFYPPLSAEQTQALEAQVDTLARPLGIEPRHLPLHDNDAATILKALEVCRGRVLLLEGNQDLLSAEQLQALLCKSTAPIILIR